nr:RNA-directed DNA polymerase, eukaryota [Tanacetum cinerariifolium]
MPEALMPRTGTHRKQSMRKSVTPRDLWRVCGTYGTVVDVFIPVKRSKAGKRLLLFVLLRPRINQFPPLNGSSRVLENQGLRQPHGSYAKVVNATSPMVNASPLISLAPVLVLDNACIVERDLSKHIMGRGVPLHAWSGETFSRIGKKLGETLNIEDTTDHSFGRKRLCLATKNPVSIIETFKIIVKGKVFMVRAKELFTWNPTFLPPKAIVYSSDDDSVQANNEKVMHPCDNDVEGGDDNASSDDGVAEMVFDTGVIEEQRSIDPFELYGLLNKRKQAEEGDGRQEDVVSPVVNAKVMNISQDVEEEVSCASVKTRGSVLGVLEEVIRVVQAMGFSMEGCLGNKTKKGWIRELSVKHKLNFIAIQKTKMESVSYMDVKAMWGNSNFDFVCSDSQGNSGGILCIWEMSVFRKDHVTISDNFIAIYGTWLPSNSKLLLVSIYAPQQAAYKRVLWEYMSILLGRWNGDAILMGDFNEVRSREERWGSCFNPYSDRTS